MAESIQVKIKQYRKETSFLSFRCALGYVLKGQISFQGICLPEGSIWFQPGGATEDIQVAAGTILIEAEPDGDMLPLELRLQSGIRQIYDTGIADTLIELLELDMESADTTLTRLALSYSLMAQVQKHFLDQPAGDHPAGEGNRTAEIASYLGKHFREPLTLEEVANQFHLSPSYFSRWFHKEFRLPLRTYLQTLRLNEACNLLTKSNLSIISIAEESGFSNYNAMAKAFRSTYGMLPSEYRQSGQQTEIPTEQAVLLKQQDISGLIKSLAARNRVSRQPQTEKLEINAAETHSFSHAWIDVLNGGRTIDCLQADVQKDIAYLKNRFGFRYLRISNLLVKELMPNKLRDDRFDYSQFFRFVDFLDSLDLQPIFDVAVKPDASFKDIHIEADPYDGDNDFWLNHFRQFLDACRTRYSAEKLNCWHFEFWLPQYWELEITEEQVKNHVDLFVRAREMIREAAPECGVGGPGLRLVGNWKQTLEQYLDALKEADALPDFLTFGLSAELGSKEIARPRPGTVSNLFSLNRIYPMDKGQYLHTWNRMLEIVKAKLDRIPALYVTETASEPVCVPGLNDGAYPAAFLVKTLLDLSGACTGVFMPRYQNRDVDYGSENTLTCGGTGLLLRHQLKSTVCFTYSLLNRLGTKLVAKGENYLFTHREDGGYAVLFHNCKLHSSYFCEAFSQEADIPFSEPRLYEDSRPLELTLQISGLSRKTYQIREYLVSDDHGCLAAEVNRLNYSGQYTNDILNYLEKITRPFQRFFRQKCMEDLSFSVSLQPNDVMLLEIFPWDT